MGSGTNNSANWKNADIYTDNVIDVYDMIEMRKLISEEEKPTTPPVTESQKPAYNYDSAKIYAEYPLSYKNTISQAGTVVKESYNGINGTNSLNVYLPYGYDENKKYNILYFIHGMGDNENSLFFNDNGEMQLYSCKWRRTWLVLCASVYL